MPATQTCAPECADRTEGRNGGHQLGLPKLNAFPNTAVLFHRFSWPLAQEVAKRFSEFDSLLQSLANGRYGGLPESQGLNEACKRSIPSSSVAWFGVLLSDSDSLRAGS